jgi:hypothetical protein
MDNAETLLNEKKISLKKKKNIFFIIFILIIILIVIFSLYLGIKNFKNIYNELSDMKKIQVEQYEQHITTNQFLLSTINWADKRNQLILFMRDCIVEQWKKTKIKNSLEDAYVIAENIMKECEKYEYIEPFFVLALQNIESGFYKESISKMGALGLYQIMPSTGRLLAGYFGIEYSDSLLFNIKISTKFAVKLLDFLYNTYQNWDQVLADYNGGPWQAFYYKNDKVKLSEETKKFVPNVIQKKKEYDSLFIKYKIDEKIRNFTFDKNNKK